MLATPAKRKLSDSIELIEGPSPKKSKPDISTLSPAQSDTPDRPKRDSKPNKRFGAPAPLTTPPLRPRPRPRPKSKNNTLRISLPNSPSSSKDVVSPPRNSMIRYDPANSTFVAVPTPDLHASPSSADSPRKILGAGKILIKSNDKSPGKTTQAQVHANWPLPSRSMLSLPGASKQLGNGLDKESQPSTITTPRPAIKRQARGLPIAFKSPPPTQSPSKLTKKKKGHSIPNSSLVIELSDSEGDHSKGPYRKPRPKGMSTPASNSNLQSSSEVIDLCSDDEYGKKRLEKSAQKPLPSRKVFQRQAIVDGVSALNAETTEDIPDSTHLKRSSTLNDSLLSRSSDDELHDCEVHILGQTPRSQDADKSTEVVDGRNLGNDVKDPMIYPTSPAQSEGNDDRDFSFYASSPHGQLDSDKQDPMIIPPLLPRVTRDSVPRLNIALDTDAIGEPSPVSSGFYIPSPIQASDNPRTPVSEEPATADHTKETENVVDELPLPLFLPGSDPSREGSATLATDPQQTPPTELQPSTPRNTRPLTPKLSNVVDLSQDKSVEVKQGSLASTNNVQSYSELGPPLNPLSINPERHPSQSMPGNVETEDGNLETSLCVHKRTKPTTDSDNSREEHEEAEYLVTSEQSAPETNELNTGTIPESHGIQSAANETSSKPPTLVHENVAQQTENARDPRLAPEPDQGGTVGVPCSRTVRQRVPTSIVTRVTSIGPGTPTIYDPTSMPPLLTPRFFSQSFLPRAFAEPEPQSIDPESPNQLLPVPWNTTSSAVIDSTEPEGAMPVAISERHAKKDPPHLPNVSTTIEDIPPVSEMESGQPQPTLPVASREPVVSRAASDDRTSHVLISSSPSKEEGEISDHPSPIGSSPQAPRINLAEVYKMKRRRKRQPKPLKTWRSPSLGVLHSLKHYPSIRKAPQDRFEATLGKLKTIIHDLSGSDTILTNERKQQQDAPQRSVSFQNDRGPVGVTSEYDDVATKHSTPEAFNPPEPLRLGSSPELDVSIGHSTADINESKDILQNNITGPTSFSIEKSPTSPTESTRGQSITELTPGVPSALTMPSTTSTPALPDEEVMPTVVEFSQDMLEQDPDLQEFMEESRFLQSFLGIQVPETTSPAKPNIGPPTSVEEHSHPHSTTSGSGIEHRNSTDSLDSPPPDTPPAPEFNDLFFIRATDTVNFDINSYAASFGAFAPSEVPEYADKVLDDIPDDFLATHDLLYPDFS